ncbi:MAG TPA: branched-chain amino acid ABC transporter permease [Candidatus Limnocylindrales bacterium]|nr:branched-chain amino acid ABC transporter permease [Candidatus Limnocylindrales bacterium]
MTSIIDPIERGGSGGLSAWVGHLVDTVVSWPRAYRHAYRRAPRRTVLLTILVILILVYPLLNRFLLQPISRGFPLPIPDDTTVVFMLIFATMAVGLNIVIGFAGLLDLGYVAFYALGAYTAAYLASPHWSTLSIVLFTDLPAGFPGIHLPFFIIFWAAALVAATFGVLLGAPTLRLRGDYLAIVTLGFGEIVPIFFKNLVNVNFELGPIKLVNANITGGPLGINPIDAPSFFGIKFGVINGFAPVYLAMAVVLLCIVIARNLERSRMGRAWMAIREDEIAAEMMGVNTVRTKLLAFGLGASFAGFAGALQASYQGATTSDFFMFATSILVVIMIILGGIGNIWGVILGAIVVQYVDKTLLGWVGQRLNDFGEASGNTFLEQINPSSFSFLLLGLALVAMMRFRPEGFLPSRQRAAELHSAPPDQVIASPGVTDDVIGFEQPLEGGPGAAELAELDPDAVDPNANVGRAEPRSGAEPDAIDPRPEGDR